MVPLFWRHRQAPPKTAHGHAPPAADSYGIVQLPCGGVWQSKVGGGQAGGGSNEPQKQLTLPIGTMFAHIWDHWAKLAPSAVRVVSLQQAYPRVDMVRLCP